MDAHHGRLRRSKLAQLSELGVPDFYQHRMGDPTRRQTFTDPAFFTGGGWTFFVSRHIAIQPALEGTFVTRDGRAYPLTSAVVRLGYHFEDHPVTP